MNPKKPTLARFMSYFMRSGQGKWRFFNDFDPLLFMMSPKVAKFHFFGKFKLAHNIISEKKRHKGSFT